MRWSLPVSPAISGASLTAERIAADLAQPVHTGADAEHCSRSEIDARVAACRPCQHSGAAGASCSDCDLRCTHPAARPGEQLITRRASTCPDNRWPTTA